MDDVIEISIEKKQQVGDRADAISCIRLNWGSNGVNRHIIGEMEFLAIFHSIWVEFCGKECAFEILRSHRSCEKKLCSASRIFHLENLMKGSLFCVNMHRKNWRVHNEKNCWSEFEKKTRRMLFKKMYENADSKGTINLKKLMENFSWIELFLDFFTSICLISMKIVRLFKY